MCAATALLEPARLLQHLFYFRAIAARTYFILLHMKPDPQ